MDLINKILFDNSLTDAEKIELLKKQALNSQKVEEKLALGDYESDVFDSDRKRCYEACEHDFTPVVWKKLFDKSKIDLANARLYSLLSMITNDDESTPLSKMTKTVENELRYKLFTKYADEYINERLEINNKSDEIFDKSLDEYFNSKKLILTLGQMFRLIKDSYYPNTSSNYAYELRRFLEHGDWDIALFYSKKDKKFYVEYPNKYRNDAAHEYVYDKNITEECKRDTIEILSWLMNSYQKDK